MPPRLAPSIPTLPQARVPPLVASGTAPVRPGRPIAVALLLLLSGVALWAPIERVQAEVCHPLEPESCMPEPGGTPLPGANVGVNKACTEQGGAYTDRTTQANNNGVGGTVDVTMGDTTLNTGSNAVYVAMNYLFARLVVDVGSAGTGGTVVWEYWNGAWTAFSGVTDNTNNLRNSGVNTVTWTLPSDWVAHDPGFTNCSGNGFYMRIRTGINYVSVPVADQISAVEYNLQMAVETELAGDVTGLVQAAFTIAVVGSGDSTVYGFREVGGGIYQWALHGVSGTHNYTIQAGKDGYVDSPSQWTAPLNTTLKTISPASLQFAFKVSSVATETGTNLAQVTVDAGDAQAVACTEAAGAWYCPVPLAHTETRIRANKTGYVTDTESEFPTDRNDGGDAQVVGTVTNVRYALNLTIVPEEDLTGVTFESNVNGAGWQSATPDGTSGTVAFFALAQDQVNVVYRATKGAITGTTGAGFQTVYTAQTERTISLVGPLAPTGVRARDLTVSATTSYAFTFTNYHAWPATGKLVVDFPATYTFGTPAVTLTNADGTASAAVAGTTVTVTRSGGSSVAASTALTVRLTEVHNPGTAGLTADFNLRLQSPAGVSLDEGLVSGVDIKPTAVVEFDFVDGSSTVAVNLSPTGPGDWFVDSFEAAPAPIEVDAAASNRNILLYFDPDAFSAQVRVPGSAVDVPLSGLDYQTDLSPPPSAGTWRSGATTRAWSATNADHPGLWIFFDDGRAPGTIADDEALMSAVNDAPASTANAANEFSPALVAADAGDAAAPTTLPSASNLRWSTASAPSISDYAFEVVVPIYVEALVGSGTGAGGSLESRYVQMLMRADGSEVAVREGGASPLGADWDVTGWDRAKAPDGLLGDETLDDYETKNVLATLFGNRYILAASTTGASPAVDLAQALAMPLRTPQSGGVFYAAVAFPSEAPGADYTWSFSLNAVNWGYDDGTALTPDEVQWP